MIVLAIVLIFIAARSIHLLGLPLYLDEGVYLWWSYLFSIDPGYAYVSVTDGKTPLFVWLVKALYPLFHDWLFTGRFLSILGAGLSLFSWIIILTRIFNKKVGLLFAILLTITPYAVLIERMAFTDSLQVGFGSLGLMFLIVGQEYWIKQHGVVRCLLFSLLSGVCVAFSYMTKTTALLLFMLQGGIIVIWILQSVWKRDVKSVIVYSLALLLMAGAYYELIGYLKVGAYRYWSAITDKESTFIYTLADILTLLQQDPLGLLHHYLVNIWLYIQYFGIYFAGLLIFLFFGVKQILFKQRQLWWLLFYSGSILILILFGTKLLASRYLYIAVPALVAVMAIGAVTLWNNTQKRRIFYTIVGVSTLQTLLMIVLPTYALYVPNDQQLFVSSYTNAYGITPAIKTVHDQNPQALLATAGIWGVGEGSYLMVREAQLLGENLDLKIKSSIPDIVTGCPERTKLIKDRCWSSTITEFAKRPEPDKYIYIAIHPAELDILYDLQPYTIIQEYARPLGITKSYLIKIN